MTGPFDPNEELPEDDMSETEKSKLENQLGDLLYPPKDRY